MLTGIEATQSYPLTRTLATQDPFAPEVLADPFPYLAALRAHAPCLRHEARDLWIVSRFADIEAVLLQPERFSSARGTGLTPVRRPVEGGVILASDHPMHRRIRRVVQPRFSMPSVEALAAPLEALVDRVLDAALEAGEVELVSSVAEPVAAWIVSEILGIDADTHDLVAWSDAGFRLLGPLEQVDVGATLDRFVAGDAFVRGVLDHGRYRPNSVLSNLAHAVKEGSLDREEAVSLGLGILVAGVDTSIASLSTAVGLLASHPDQWSLLRAAPELAAPAFEEALRYDGPILYWFRHCNETTEVAGTAIPRGARVMISLASADRDAARFPDPDRFDVLRDAKGNLAFGRGEHLCLGAQVARLEGRVVLKKLAERVRALEPTAAAERRRVAMIRAFERVPVRLVPA